MITRGGVIGGRYEILDRISEGGMATVFRARRLPDGVVVALKVLREQFASDAEFVERFEREAKAVATLTHAHMVRVYDSGRDGDVHFIAMEYIEGEDLKAHIRRAGRIAPQRAREIAAQVCEALEYAHAHGVIHRDVKPQNILLTPEGDVKVTDFGIARALSSATITQTGTVLGSVQYLSPEQARGGTVGRAADLYSLGVVLFEMVTGQLPFAGDSPIATALAHVNQAPPPPRSIVPDLPPSVEGIILLALAKSPARRYRSAGEMRGDLAGETDLWTLVEPQTLLEHTPPTTRLPLAARRRASPALVGTLVAVALVGGLWGGWRAFSGYLAVPEVTVPRFVGRPLSLAQQVASGEGLSLFIVDRVHSTTASADTVISQDQPPGKTVKRGRSVGVVISLGPEIVTVPDVQRRSLIEARLMIEQARLSIGELRETFDEEVKGGFVISQDPQPGARVQRGRGLNLVISKGPALVEMPRLVGRPLQEARRILEELGITVREVRTTPTADLDPGIVVAQAPEPGTRVRPQDRVTVTVTVRPGEERTPPPTPIVTAQPQQPPPTTDNRVTRDEKLTRVELVVPVAEAPQEVRIVVIDEQGVRTVFQKALAPGSRLSEMIRSRGYTIIQVYIGNRLIQEIRP
ncbi:MAG TPA: PASTA domain-containing protein [bacterium]|nr:PASTA domain-containing protein [bacterium]